MRKLAVLMLSAMTLSACGGGVSSVNSEALITTEAAAPTTTSTIKASTALTMTQKQTTTSTAPAVDPKTIWTSVQGWDCASNRHLAVSARYANGTVELEFSTSPSSQGFSELAVQTAPSITPREYAWDANSTSGSSLHHLRRIAVTDLESNSVSVTLTSPTQRQVNIQVGLAATHSDGTICQANIFPNIDYESGPSLSDAVLIPDGVSVNNDRYSSFVMPEPTAQALIYSISQNDPYGPAVDENIFDYPAKLRVALYGEPTTNHWRTVADILEVLQVIAPDLDARFAQTHDEVTFPIHVTTCANWQKQTALRRFTACNANGMGGYFSNGDIQSGATTSSVSRGFVWIDNGTYSVTNLRHEIGHAMGLPHVNCAGSMMIVPDNQGQFWNASDLGAIAVHQDSRTTDKMTLEQARKALNIPQDYTWESLLADRTKVCDNSSPAFDVLAADLKSNSLK